MEEIVKYAVLAILVLSQTVQWILKRPIKYNPHPPGQASRCVEHGEDIARIEARLDGMDKRLDRIEGKINGKKG